MKRGETIEAASITLKDPLEQRQTPELRVLFA
mgnify:CR=1 FL=1